MLHSNPQRRHHTQGIVATMLAVLLMSLLISPLQARAQSDGSTQTFTPMPLMAMATNSTANAIEAPDVLLQALTLPTALSVGVPFSINATWSYQGVPLDSDWEVVYQFRNTDTNAVTEFVSASNLADILQTSTATVADEFQLERGVSEGAYTVDILVRDPVAQRSPLALAIAGVQADGSYLLGSIDVRAGTAARPTVSRIFIPMVGDARGSVPQLPGDLQTFTPQQVSFDAPEIVNPLRGLYRWNGQEYAPQSKPSPDAYGRYTWRELEPAQGDYAFAELEADVAKAAREGRKYSFRVRTLVSINGSSVPDYAMDNKGWWADYDHNGKRDTYVPDWNDPTFLRRLDTFMQALGKRYNGDPRIGFVDIGLYGNWGEWHVSGFRYPSANGAQRATKETKQRLVDMEVDAFPTTPLVMMTDDTDALVYAMQRSPRIGWRRDSLGWDTGHFGKIERDPVRWNAIKDRWKTALVVTEFCNPRFQEDPQVFQQAMKEVQQYHVSLVSNANTIKWQSLSVAGQRAFVQLGKTAGYRLNLESLTLPKTLAAGSSFGITTRWSNSGVAPVYESWQVHVQLRLVGSSSVAWETTSAVDLTKVLPGGPITLSDAVTLPKTIAQGAYDVVVVVQDPRQTRTPLALTLAGVQADGSYRVGSVRVQ